MARKKTTKKKSQKNKSINFVRFESQAEVNEKKIPKFPLMNKSGSHPTQYFDTKIVTRNFVMDIVAGWQNFFGMNLTSYEKMVNKGMKQLTEELEKKMIKLSWYRYEITQLTNGALSITLYGDIE